MTSQTPDPHARPKRFWKAAAPGPEGEGGWPVLLDGRGAKTPARAKLVLPTEALARLVAQEWDAQGEHLDYATMPATRLAFTAIDRVGAAHEAVADEVARYAGADLLCYFAEGPQSLLEREVEHWGPLLAWAEEDLGLRFERASGVVHKPQPPETVERIRVLAGELDDFNLAGVSWATALLGSVVLAFAMQREKLDGASAFDLSRLDETFQEERWGVDTEAADRAAKLKAEAVLLQRWFEALVR